MRTILVFGSQGSLGSQVVNKLRQHGYEVLAGSRAPGPGVDVVVDTEDWVTEFRKDWNGHLDGVVWAQGLNARGDAVGTSHEAFLGVFEANVGFVHASFSALFRGGLLSQPSRGVVISSVWQRIARPEKFAYMVSKSAISGLVKSLNIDFSERGFTCNAVLPGVTDSPMTHAQLNKDQLQKIENETPGRALVSIAEVVEVVAWLLSDASAGVAGQSIVVDKGWSDAKGI